MQRGSGGLESLFNDTAIEEMQGAFRVMGVAWVVRDHADCRAIGVEFLQQIHYRVAVARALAGEPLILLADEPTGNLDSKNGDAVMDLLKELHNNGATICMVTHDPRYAHHAERTLHLFDGRIVDQTIAPV